VNSGVDLGKAVLVDLLETLLWRFNVGTWKDNMISDFIKDVLKPALKKFIENLVPTIEKYLGDLVDKLVPSRS